MDDVISRQAAIDEFYKYPNVTWTTLDVLKHISELPSAQRTGRWKVANLPKGKMKYCSECGFGQYIADERQYRFCPNCGARMEVEE